MTDSTDDLNLAVMAERLKSLRDISERDFREIKTQLDDMRGLPIRVEQLSGKVDAVIERVDDLENIDVRGTEYRRTNLPVILLTIVIVLISLAGVIAQVAST